MKTIFVMISFCLLAFAPVCGQTKAKPFLESEMIFPLEHWHNHASAIVEAPNGDLLVCWFHGSGERQADDVIVEGARKKKGAKQWSPRFTMADTPGYPDTNCTMFVDPQGRLWLMWPTIMANLWESALMKYKIASRWTGDGAPKWDVQEVLHVTPGQEFVDGVNKAMDQLENTNAQSSEYPRENLQAYIARMRKMAADKLTRRIGWMTRAHPFVVDNKRLIVPLYSDGFSISLMAITDDWGRTWHTSTPLVGGGNIQPSIVRKKDGTLYTLMRDNGPAPKRLHQSESKDNGETWSPVTDSEHPNPGAGAEIISLRNDHWALIYNDLERGRHSLAVAISDDEGKTWKWKRHLELDASGAEAGSFHYPSLIQAKDGTLHATYSYFVNKKEVSLDKDGKPMRKTIKHAHFNEEWVMEGDRK
ncbi:MAG: exo-alpha-sialidase [Blastocatellia bacterium]|nr:exo-alpha-sialidase [Blastocatellia bacterium]